MSDSDNTQSAPAAAGDAPVTEPGAAQAVAADAPAEAGVKVPWHFWLVGVLALLWNAVGAFNYSATQFRLEFYMSQFTEEQLAYFYGFPAWADAAWAVGVWGSVLGSLALLIRKDWAQWLFGLSIVGMFVSFANMYVLSPEGMEIAGGAGPVAFSIVIVVIAVALFVYAGAMKRKGVLK